MVPEGADGAGSLAVVARARGRVVAVEQVRIGAGLAVRTDQRSLRQLLAALARHQDLALGHDRGGEVEDQRVLAGPRDADAIGRSREATLHATERRHEDAARSVDEMDRHEARFGRHLRPVTDAADMAGIAQRHRRKTVLEALVDADLHRLRSHGLAEAVLAVDHGDHRRIDQHVDLHVGNDGAGLLLRGIARHADHAVTVVARQVGTDEVATDAATLLFRASRRGKDVRDEGFEFLRLDRHVAHVRTCRVAGWRRSRGSRSG